MVSDVHSNGPSLNLLILLASSCLQNTANSWAQYWRSPHTYFQLIVHLLISFSSHFLSMFPYFHSCLCSPSPEVTSSSFPILLLFRILPLVKNQLKNLSCLISPPWSPLLEIDFVPFLAPYLCSVAPRLSACFSADNWCVILPTDCKFLGYLLVFSRSVGSVICIQCIFLDFNGISKLIHGTAHNDFLSKIFKGTST